MKELINKIIKLTKKNLYLSVFLVFIVISFYHLSIGFHMSSDSYRFSRWADDLIKLNFNYFDFFAIEKGDHRPHLYFFSVPVSLTGLSKVFFASDWQIAFLSFNLVLLFFSLIIFVNSLMLIGVRPILITLALPLILLSVDLLTWPRYILSDTIYSFFVLLTTYFVVKGIVNNKIYYIELFLSILLLIGTRPSSIPVVFAIILFILISKYQILLKPKNILTFALLFIFILPFIFSFIYLIIDLNFKRIPNLDYLIGMVKVGMIIHDRPETWRDVPTGFLDVVFIYFLRFINFFNPYAKTFSILHILLNLLQFFSIFISIVIWSFLGKYKKIQNKAFIFIIILTFSVTAFHSFTVIDYDWRYRFPLILPLLMLFPISLSMFLDKNKN